MCMSAHGFFLLCLQGEDHFARGAFSTVTYYLQCMVSVLRFHSRHWGLLGRECLASSDCTDATTVVVSGFRAQKFPRGYDKQTIHARRLREILQLLDDFVVAKKPLLCRDLETVVAEGAAKHGMEVWSKMGQPNNLSAILSKTSELVVAS